MSRTEMRVTVVILTHNRREEVLRTVGRLRRLPDPICLCVVDNASSDGTADALRAAFPDLHVIAAARNLGAAGRNLGVQWARTPYVAFCDDDTCWEPHALERAADILDLHPRVATLCAQVRVGAEGRSDPTCERMAQSPLPSHGLPGKALLGFLAGASVMRASAFLQAGGYHPAFFIGAEEALLALDLAAAGWHMVYCPEIVTRHEPSPQRDVPARRFLLARNELWTAWLRLPLLDALDETVRVGRRAREELGGFMPLVLAALRGLPWIVAQRRVVPPEVMAMRRLLRNEAVLADGAAAMSRHAPASSSPEQ
ncbi:MAG: glycosyltransferase family 2 protein [Pigmentiphaga sp.]|uniref:glycosyltransferase family 2 protein n=1 Tax=Pigmentiphaga sp. TaxID=1977564 RepID=UPI0029B3613F|nr:glycosyltransferase family 2 protein [Pigmentiphaga sp.]MDX3907855.1 glycosyltransferase family 2 protein [Pigmentiphaga sp.]